MPLPYLRTHALAPILFFAVACLIALSLASAAAAASSKTVPAQIRVVDSNGDRLADQTQYTNGVKFKTDPKADCFGDGTGGSGDTVKVPGATALGLLADTGISDPDVKPLSVSDSFDFGLALCGVGDAISPQSGYWYLKQNHAGSQSGGDQTKVNKGDDILWYLIEDFNDPIPDELVLKTPTNVEAGSDVEVKVLSYDDAGKRSPAKRAKVTGAKQPTDAKGITTVAADSDLLQVTATRKGSIPSAVQTVCTLATIKCPAGYAARIGGTNGRDKINVSKLATTVIAKGGNDKIVATRGSATDLIRCGGGEDKVVLSKHVRRKAKVAGCEKVKTTKG